MEDVSDELENESGAERRGIDLDAIQEARQSTSGTFNPFAAFGLGGGSAAERTARNTDRMAEDMRRARENLDNMRDGWVFE
jgi:hypothetical protein